MKNTFTLFILLLICGLANAQLTFSSKTIDLVLSSKGNVDAYITVSNNSGKQINFLTKVLEETYNPDWGIQYCACTGCADIGTGKPNATVADALFALDCTFIDDQSQNDWKLSIDMNGLAASTGILKLEVNDTTNNIIDTLTFKIVDPADPTSIVEVKNDVSVNYFPNPVEDVLNIDATFENEGNANLNLIDVLGHIVKSQTIEGNSNFSFDVSQITSGVYFLVMEKEGQVLFTEKIIKR